MQRVKTAVLILCLMSSGFKICADELLDLRSVLDSQKGNQLINVPKGHYVLDWRIAKMRMGFVIWGESLLKGIGLRIF